MVTKRVLSKPPLVEAIFELRWALKESERGIALDPHYKMLVGRLYDKLMSEYPEHEQLPSSAVPDEIASYLVMHRFRKAKGSWPLVQLGPGVITVNDTERYEREDFERRIARAVDSLFAVYPESQTSLAVARTLVRYIDSVEIGPEEDAREFLADKLKLSVRLHENLFEETGVANKCVGLDVRLAFPCSAPEGLVHLRFCTGDRFGRPAIIWETMIESRPDGVPKTREQINDWVAKSNNVVHSWFFQLIEGELLQRFE